MSEPIKEPNCYGCFWGEVCALRADARKYLLGSNITEMYGVIAENCYYYFKFEEVRKIIKERHNPK